MIAPRSHFLENYISLTPLALAIERSLECRILSQIQFERPVLDIGCGDGIFASVLFDGKVDVGIDPNPVELEHARKVGSYSRVVQCRGDDIPELDGSYRTIFSNSVLEHIPDVNPVLREAHRLLSSGGLLCITVPTDRFEYGSVISRMLRLLRLRGLDEKFRQFYNRFWVHYHCYRPDRWSEILNDAGFSVVSVRQYAPIDVCTLNDILVPFGLPGFILKRTRQEWVLFPALRRRVLSPLAKALDFLLRNAHQTEDGGLVCILARKP